MIFLLFLLVAAMAYQVLTLVCLARFFQKPLPSQALSGSPGITVFKPVKGLDQESRWRPRIARPAASTSR